MTPAELKHIVLERFPDFFYCDPDYYPVAHQDEMVLALERFPQIQADREQFQAILQHLGWQGKTTFTDAEKLAIYRESKKVAALSFELTDGAYRFQLQTGTEGQSGEIITGTIDGQGRIEVEGREQGFPTCPICLSAGSLIDTPLGAVSVEELRIGDPVWTMDAGGERVAATVRRLARAPVAQGHRVVHLVLRDGRELLVSPGHPAADGRSLGRLRIGDTMDGARVVLVELVPYGSAATYDLLPSGPSGLYWVNGIPMASTLATSPR
jgi:hypothetical protein